MRKLAKLLGITALIALVAVIGFTVAGCKEDDGGGGGDGGGGLGAKDVLDGTTWGVTYEGEYEGEAFSMTLTLEFDSPNFTYTDTDNITGQIDVTFTGTYSVSGNTVTLYNEKGNVWGNGAISGNTIKITYPDDPDASMTLTKQ